MDESQEVNPVAEALRFIVEGHHHEQEVQRHEAEKTQCYEKAGVFLSLAFAEDLARFCDNIVGEALGEDMAQNALLAAWKAMSTFRAPKGMDSLKPWVFKIALNLCRKELRERRRANRSQQLLESTGAAKPKRRGSHRLNRYRHWQGVYAAVLVQAIEKLDDDTDKLLLKIDMADNVKTLKDIADLVGMKDDSVRQRIRRAIRRVDAILGL